MTEWSCNQFWGNLVSEQHLNVIIAVTVGPTHKSINNPVFPLYTLYTGVDLIRAILLRAEETW